jgi:hypothetical protein
MTQPKGSAGSDTPQGFIEENADDIKKLGHPVIAEAVRGMNPDADPTDFSGGGTFNAARVADAIGKDAANKAKDWYTNSNEG